MQSDYHHRFQEANTIIYLRSLDILSVPPYLQIVPLESLQYLPFDCSDAPLLPSNDEHDHTLLSCDGS